MGPWTQAVNNYDATEPTGFGYVRIELPNDGISTRYLRLNMQTPVAGIDVIGISEVLLYGPLSANVNALQTDITTLQVVVKAGSTADLANAASPMSCRPA